MPENTLLPTGNTEVLFPNTAIDAIITSRADGKLNRFVTIGLRLSQAIKIHKLLSMPGDPIPEYKGEKHFALHVSIPSEPGETAAPYLSADGEDVLLETDLNAIRLSPADQTALCECFEKADYTLASDSGGTIVTLPAMSRLAENIEEPLLHKDCDEVLEHIHSPQGYWSPTNEKYYD